MVDDTMKNDEDDDVSDLLRSGTFQQVAEEMDSTEFLVQQLISKFGKVEEEYLAVQADAAKTDISFSQKVTLDIQMAGIKARKDVLVGHLIKARKRLEQLQTKFWELNSGKAQRSETQEPIIPTPTPTKKNKDVQKQQDVKQSRSATISATTTVKASPSSSTKSESPFFFFSSPTPSPSSSNSPKVSTERHQHKPSKNTISATAAKLIADATSNIVSSHNFERSTSTASTPSQNAVTTSTHTSQITTPTSPRPSKSITTDVTTEKHEDVASTELQTTKSVEKEESSKSSDGLGPFFFIGISTYVAFGQFAHFVDHLFHH